ncbi:hypothetical protein ACK8HY_20365 [Sphingobacterium sp. NGMCC 1.201703]|uniref:hypothetical protein n=1 Tax=Sphingobacterium sp. NGMCC 1.201703 TaxID=3388657 RepID=UPI0039FD1B13
MEVTINRFWSIDDDEGLSRASILLKRPRVDAQISHYVFDYTWTKILSPKKLMQKGDYSFTLYFDVMNETHKFFYDSIYNTDTVKFHPAYRNRKYNGMTTTEVSISCKCNLFDEQITPEVYAGFVYDMFGSYFVEAFKKVSKEELDTGKQKMDFSEINKFPFPASFDSQKYSGDSGGVEKRVVNFVVDESSDAFMFRETYIAHYGF